MNIIQRIFLVVCLSMIGFLAGACNTVEGAGKDIKKGGEAIEDAAQDAK